MFGFEWNEQFYAEMQRKLPGFDTNGAPLKSQEAFDEILHKVRPKFKSTKHNTDAFSDTTLYQYFDEKNKILSEINLVILSFIFVCYYCDLNFAQRMLLLFSCQRILTSNRKFRYSE